MITAKTVAEYFLSKDPDRKLFNKNVVEYNDRKFYEGNARLNKYLFLSQVVHLAKYDCKLFEDDFCAYDNGPVVEDIMNSYGRLIGKQNNQVLDDSRALLFRRFLHSFTSRGSCGRKSKRVGSHEGKVILGGR